jgi:hypothetical protein
MAKESLTQEELKSRLNYNPDTGIFTWRTNIKSTLIGAVVLNRLKQQYWLEKILLKNYRVNSSSHSFNNP